MGSTSLVSQEVAVAALRQSQRQDVLPHMCSSPEARSMILVGKKECILQLALPIGKTLLNSGFPTHEHSDVVHPFGITIFPAHLNTHLESADVRKWSELSKLSMQ